MFPKWEFDVEDMLAKNIIKLMFVKRPWKWTMDCWEVTGTWVNTNPAVVSPAKKKVAKEDSPRPRKNARKKAPAEASEKVHTLARSEVTTTVGGLTKEDIKTMFKDIVDTIREGFGTCLKEIKYLSERVEAVEKKSESVNGTNAGRKILPEDKGPDVPADASSSKDKAPEPSLVLLDKNQPTHIDAWINVLRKRYDANPQHFRSERMCFIDHLFAQQWRFNYKDFKDSEPDRNGLGRRLPGGAWNYYAGTIPSFCQSNQVWGTDIDDVYVPVNYNDTHWIAMCISIPKRHIVVLDSICSSISPEELDVARAGDCGMYALKYIECHALGIPFSKKDFAKPNGKTMRNKMAMNIFKELPDAHEG
uniref:Ubiquitin-like protease family profile domain-containing protein n=1 Tax=Brassica oleracea var. oleracea TaxID=109376 RepID=A0A0D3CJ80_BRAOL